MQKKKIFNIILYILCFFLFYTKSESSYIIEENDITKLLKILSHKEFSLILIYSPYCPHCRNFHPHYEKLANKFHEKVHFYKINAIESSSYRSKFNIRGYPSLWFYYNDSYTEYNQFYNYDFLEPYISKNYLFDCSKLSLNQFEAVKTDFYNNDKLMNFVILFGKEPLISLYTQVIKENIIYIDNCYYIEEKAKNELFTDTIMTYSKQKGINTFTEYKNRANDDNNEFIKERLTKFIQQYLFNLYTVVEGDQNLNFLITETKSLVIFTYNSNEMFYSSLRQIKHLNLMDKSENNTLFDYILFDYNKKNRFLSYKKFSSGPGIYLSDKKLQKIEEIKNISTIEEMIIQNNQASISQAEIINNQLEKSKNEYYINFFTNFNWKSLLFKIICLIIYTILFFYIFKKYNSIQNKIISDNKKDFEELKQLKDSTNFST